MVFLRRRKTQGTYFGWECADWKNVGRLARRVAVEGRQDGEDGEVLTTTVDDMAGLGFCWSGIRRRLCCCGHCGVIVEIAGVR